MFDFIKYLHVSKIDTLKIELILNLEGFCQGARINSRGLLMKTLFRLFLLIALISIVSSAGISETFIAVIVILALLMVAKK